MAFEYGFYQQDPRAVSSLIKPAFQINDPESLRYQVLTFGNDQNRVVAIDNFFKNPELTREFAFSLDFKPASFAFPGVRADVSDDMQTDPIVQFAAEAVMSKVLGIEGDPVALTKLRTNEDRAFNWVTMGRGAAATVKQTHQDYPLHSHLVSCPHTDGTWMNVLIHLTLPEYVGGGTALWRHRETGLESWMRFFVSDPLLADKISRSLGNNVFRKMLDAFIDRPELTLEDADLLFQKEVVPLDRLFLAESNDHWECIGVLPCVYNRMYVFPGWQFHSVVLDDELDTSSAEKARLTLTMFVPPYVVEDVE